VEGEEKREKGGKTSGPVTFTTNQRQGRLSDWLNSLTVIDEGERKGGRGGEGLKIERQARR